MDIVLKLCEEDKWRYMSKYTFIPDDEFQGLFDIGMFFVLAACLQS